MLFHIFVLLFAGTHNIAAQASSRTSTQTVTCTQYAVQDGDTCLKVAKKHKATYAQIVSWNRNVPSLCSKLKSLQGTKICVSNPSGDFGIPTNTKGDTSIATAAAPVPSKVPNDTNKNCGQYVVVKEGQDCSSLLAASSITMDDFIVLNPQVWRNCTNLWLDYSYCVKPVGAITTYPGYGGTAAPSATSRPFKKTESTDKSDHNSTTDPLDRFKTSGAIIPIANGTRLDCQHYYWIQNTTDNSLANCYGLAMIYNIEFEDFILWNPSLADTSKADAAMGADAALVTDTITDTNDFANTCTVSSSVSYCVGLSSPTTSADAGIEIETPTPRAAGEIGNCTMWFRLERETPCDNLMVTWGLKHDEFLHMNPSAKADCSGLSLGTFYCRSTYPGGRGVGIPGWHSDEEDDDEIGPETSIASKTPEAGATTTKQATASPVQTGILKSCTKYHEVIEKDTCYDIAQGAKIDLETFYKWNPAVHTDCSDLELGTYVCVGSS